MPELLPLFPLRLVALPGISIPLHIFEERYKEMVGEAVARGTEFGIVLAKEGGIVNAGCTVLVEKVIEKYSDGRFDVLTRGRRRFSLLALDHERAYLRGEVQFFEDEDREPAAPELRQKAFQAWRDVQSACDLEDAEIDPGHPLLSFQLAQRINDLDFQNVILRTRSESERLRQFTEFAKEYVPRSRYIEKMKRTAPTNGSGHTPAVM
jgi:Lon protease-like protein